MLRFYLVLATALGLAAAGAAQKADAPMRAATVNLNAIVEHMEAAAESNRANYRPYVITRDYLFFESGSDTPGSEVKAEVSFVPPDKKEFRITESKGSSRAEKVVRNILENESKAAATGRAPGAVSTENYTFTYLGEGQFEGNACFILGLQPHEAAKSLVVGRAWVDKRTYLVHRIDGEMSKLPSWWLKSVHLTLDFGDLDGMWIQKATRAVAEVRIFGTHVMNERAINFESGPAVAKSARPRSRSRADYALGAAVIPR